MVRFDAPGENDIVKSECKMSCGHTALKKLAHALISFIDLFSVGNNAIKMRDYLKLWLINMSRSIFKTKYNNVAFDHSQFGLPRREGPKDIPR